MAVTKAEFKKQLKVNNHEYLFEKYLTTLTTNSDKLILNKYVMEKQYKFHPKRKFKLDFAFMNKKKKLAVEIDGGQYCAYGGSHNRDKDRIRTGIAMSMGWEILRFSTQQIDKDPHECIKILIDCLYD